MSAIPTHHVLKAFQDRVADNIAALAGEERIDYEGVRVFVTAKAVAA